MGEVTDLTGSLSREPVGLFPISPGQRGGGEIALKSCWLETLIIMTVLRFAAVLLSAEGSAHLAVMLSQNSQDGL